MSQPPGRFPPFPLREPLPVPGPSTGDPEYIPVSIPFEWMPYIVSLLIPMTYHSFWAGDEAQVNAAVDRAEALIAEFAGEGWLLPGWFWTLSDTEKSVLDFSTRLGGIG
jgi:hypothetical protein